jgi:hypothetical protein
MYLGVWNIAWNGVAGEMDFEFREDTLVPIERRAQWAGLHMTFLPNGSSLRRSVVAEVKRADPRVLRIAYDDVPFGRVELTVYMLSHQRGVFAGEGTVGGSRVGARAELVAPHGRFERFGAGCSGLAHDGSGIADRGRAVTYVLRGAPAAIPAALAAGARFALPIDLAMLGAPGCWLHVNPFVTFGAMTSAAGEARLPLGLPGSWAIGAVLDTTFVALPPVGLRTSNALATVFGGRP